MTSAVENPTAGYKTKMHPEANYVVVFAIKVSLLEKRVCTLSKDCTYCQVFNDIKNGLFLCTSKYCMYKYGITIYCIDCDPCLRIVTFI